MSTLIEVLLWIIMVLLAVVVPLTMIAVAVARHRSRSSRASTAKTGAGTGEAAKGWAIGHWQWLLVGAWVFVNIMLWFFSDWYTGFRESHEYVFWGIQVAVLLGVAIPMLQGGKVNPYLLLTIVGIGIAIQWYLAKPSFAAPHAPGYYELVIPPQTRIRYWAKNPADEGKYTWEEVDPVVTRCGVGYQKVRFATKEGVPYRVVIEYESERSRSDC